MRGINVDSETELVSAASDGDVVVWNLNDQIPHCVLKGSNVTVNVVDGLYCSENRENTIIASVPMEPVIKIWFRHKAGGKPFKKIQ